MADDIWTVQRILEWIEGYLAKHGDDNARLSAQWLVADALSCSRMQLFLDMQRPLTAGERATLRDYARRRAAGEPLQYITGSVDFRHITVRVKPGVLIPRPETEVLVSEALALLPTAPKPQDALDAEVIALYRELNGTSEDSDPSRNSREAVLGSSEETARTGGRTGSGRLKPDDAPSLLVADICTGSGCIACSLAAERPDTHVIATDISPEAIALAQDNAEQLRLSGRIDFIECDLGGGIDANLMGAFDLVVSNPPYVPSAVIDEIPVEVSAFEPRLALDGGPDGLDVYRRLLEWTSQALKPSGSFAFELHETCLEQAAHLASLAGFERVGIAFDLANRPRILTGAKAREA